MTHRSKIKSLLCFATVIGVLVAPVNASIVNITDTNFVDNDWSLTTVQKNNGGTIFANQSNIQVNTAPFARFVEHSINAGTNSAASSVAGLHLKTSAVYDPAMQGAINHICFSIDYDFAVPGPGNVGLGAMLQQNGKWYAGGFTGTPDGVGFSNFATSLLGSNNFVEVDLANSTPLFINSSHPDFSSTGTPITFGFITGNSNSTSNPIQYSRAYYFDDWAVSVKAVPEPCSAGLMMALGAIGLFRRSRR